MKDNSSRLARGRSTSPQLLEATVIGYQHHTNREAAGFGTRSALQGCLLRRTGVCGNRGQRSQTPSIQLTTVSARPYSFRGRNDPRTHAGKFQHLRLYHRTRQPSLLLLQLFAHCQTPRIPHSLTFTVVFLQTGFSKECHGAAFSKLAWVVVDSLRILIERGFHGVCLDLNPELIAEHQRARSSSDRGAVEFRVSELLRDRRTFQSDRCV